MRRTGGIGRGWLGVLAVLVGVCWLQWSWAAGEGEHNSAIAQLHRFVAQTQQASGRFTQTVHAASGRQPQQASGQFSFSRPGKFRWEYEQPYPQLLVSDGRNIWSWDRDLNQVTVKALGDALDGTPVAVLVGQGALEDEFELRDGGEHDALSWVEARPKNSDSSFEFLRLGLTQGQLQRMELKDHFGQRTLIMFSDFVADATLEDGLFQFIPPPDADVIGEPD